MRNLTIIFCTIMVAFGLMSLNIAAGQEDFEGTFTYQITMEKSGQSDEAPIQSDIAFYVKGSKTLIKNERSNTAYNFKMLLEGQDEEFYILLDRGNRKVAMKQDLQTIQNRNKSGNSENKAVQFEKTEETKTVGGYECTRYKVNQHSYKGSAWITQELALEEEMKSVFQIMKQHPKSKKGFGAVSASNYPEKGVVMASSLKAKDSNRVIKSKMKGIEEKDLKAKHFDISQYQVMNMNGTPASFGR